MSGCVALQDSADSVLSCDHPGYDIVTSQENFQYQIHTSK